MTQQQEQVTRPCDICSTETAVDDLFTLDSTDMACQDCTASCQRCDWVGSTNDSWYTVSDESWCEGCWEQHSFSCERCDYTYDDNNTSWSRVHDDRWCQYCIEDNATYCESCDEYYEDGDECGNCDDSQARVHDYSYRPNPVFHGEPSNNLYMGFELEMELNNTNKFKQAIQESKPLEDSDILYLKHDGSIAGRGFELVTHPHSLEEYASASTLWDYIERLRTEYSARSWDTDSCGLHVHVSRSTFRSGAHTHRFLTLIYKNPREMMKLAGRKNSRYASFSDVYKPDEWGIPRFSITDKVHKGISHTERYSAVNTNNDYTLELRFFRGNMKREGVMTALELCHASVEYTRTLTLSDVKLGALRWDWFYDWVSANNGTYPNLYLRMSKVPMVMLNDKPLLNA